MLRRLNSGRSDNSREIQVETTGSEDTKKSKIAFGSRSTRSNSKGQGSTGTDIKLKHNFNQIVVTSNRNVPPKYPGKKNQKGTPAIILPDKVQDQEDTTSEGEEPL